MNRNHKVRFDAISRPWRSKTLIGIPNRLPECVQRIKTKRFQQKPSRFLQLSPFTTLPNQDKEEKCQ